MYCDINPEGVLADHNDDTKHLGSPRQQVFETLAELLKEDKHVSLMLAAVRSTIATLKFPLACLQLAWAMAL